MKIGGLQELLPPWFSRGFAWKDLWISLAGGMIGIAVSAVAPRRRAMW